MPVELGHRVDAAEFGWKAHYLGLLGELGFRTPPAVAYGIDEQVDPNSLRLSAFAFAVRSSAPSEDTFDESKAGWFETLLDVPRRELSEACERVRASAMGQPMPVIVQEFVQATTSGVAFSIEPRSYAYQQWTVSWTAGTGEALVSGQGRAHDVVIDKATGAVVSGEWHGSQGVLSELGSALTRLADELSGPVDVEWCLDPRGVLNFLQVRPVVLPAAAIISLGSSASFQRLPAVASGHPKLALRRKAQELGVPMTPCRVTIATARQRLPQPEVVRSPKIAGSSVVLLHPFAVDRRIVREFAKVDGTDVEFYTSECRRYSIRNYPTFDSIARTESSVAEIGLDAAAVAVVLEQEIWNAEVTGLVRRVDDGFLLEVGLGHFVPKGYVQTSAYLAGTDGRVRKIKEVEHQSTSFHFINGHVLREENPPGNSILTRQQVWWVIDSLRPLLEAEPHLALEFGITSRGDSGVVYLIDAAESDEPGVRFEADRMAVGVISHGQALGPIVDLRGHGQAEDLNAHLLQSVVGEGPEGPTVYIAPHASVDLLPLLLACPPGCGFLFEDASLLAHFAVVLRERGTAGVVLPAEELNRLAGVVRIDTTASVPVIGVGP